MITTYYTGRSEPINADLLLEELRAALGPVVVGVVHDGERVGGYFDDSVQPITDALLSQALAILTAHDWTKRTEKQRQSEEDAERARNLSMLITKRIAWHEANPLTGANAVNVAARMQEEWVYFLHLLRGGYFGGL